MDVEYIIFRGQSVSRDWPEKIAAAQSHMEWVINGQAVPRVRFGEEPDDWGADRGPCRDCVVVKGEFHVVGCDVERCPNCGGQVIGCDCPYDGDEAD